ncbi:MAG: LacI family DNA-binding transcriptional regulator [Rhodobacteraceae bacterium]|nr:LacI family DNA-binding transcriptional regulator [Paracoccaceae bacterium]
MRRVRIADIVRESGFSRATVDRVLNSRKGVHPRTRAVIEAASRSLRHRQETPPNGGIECDILFRLGSGMTGQVKAAIESIGGGDVRFFNMYQQTEGAIAARVRRLCEDTSRPLVLCVKDTERSRILLTEARKRGKKVVALISDLPEEARDSYVGIDNRAAGKTAAFLTGRTFGDRPTNVGVVLGDYAFRCHEDREIGFRTCLREYFPRLALAAEVQGEDNPDRTYRAVLEMLEQHPAIAAIYNLSGGNEGLARALVETGRRDDMLVISHEVNSVTMPLMHSGTHDYLISQDPHRLISEAFRVLRQSAVDHRTERVLLDYSIHTPFNIPSYARQFGIGEWRRPSADTP